MDSRFITVEHEGENHTVGLYPGLSPLELSKLLTTVFSSGGHGEGAAKAVVGFQDETGTVLPISLACAAPHLLSHKTYKLLLTDSESFFGSSSSPCTLSPSPPCPTRPATDPTSQDPNKAADWAKGQTMLRSQSAPSVTQAGQEGEESRPGAEREKEEEEEEGVEEEVEEEGAQGEGDGEEEDDDDESVAAEALDEETTSKLLRFAKLLSLQSVLSGAEHQVIHEGLTRGSRVLTAAYYVAQHRKSVQLLSLLWKAVAGNALSERGLKLVILAQENLLEILDLLRQAHRLTRVEHVTLQHLVLLQVEAVADAYDGFRSHDDLDVLTTALKDIAAQGDALIEEAMREAGQTEEEDEEEEEEEGQDEEQEGRRLTLEEVVAEMNVDGEQRQYLGQWLLEQHRQGQTVVKQAYEDYKADGDKRKLLVVLFRVLKIEVNRRAAEAAAAANALQQQGGGGKAEQAGALDVSRWEGKVPRDLMTALLRLAECGALSLEDTEDLLDLSITEEDEDEEEEEKDARQFIKAAWDVYQLERDPGDLVDSLQRILRICREKMARKAPLVMREPGDAEVEMEIMRRSVLAQCLDIMIGQRSIDLAGFRALVGLLDGGSEIVTAAIDAFLVDEDAEELLDTLRLIAQHATSASAPPLAEGPSSTEESAKMDGSKDGDEAKAAQGGGATGGSTGGTTDDGESLGEEEDMSFASDRAVQPSTAASVASYSSLMTLDDDRESEAAADLEREEMLQALVATGALGEAEAAFLTDLMYHSRERPLIHAIIADYVSTKDAALLGARLRELVNLVVNRSASRSIEELDGESDDEEDDEEEDEDEEEGEDGAVEDDGEKQGQEEEEEEQGVSSQTMADIDHAFLEIVQEMNPSNLETAALRLCLARKDEVLTSALELYQVSGDAEDLKDTLRRVARQTIFEISKELPDSQQQQQDEEREEEVERESSERAKGGEEGGEASRGGETQRPEAGEWEHVETPGAEGGSKPAATTGNSPPRGPAKAAAVGDAEGENVGDCHKQEVLSELVGHSFISSEERDRALSFTDDEANEVLASAIQAYDKKQKTAQDLATTLRELLDDGREELMM